MCNVAEHGITYWSKTGDPKGGLSVTKRIAGVARSFMGQVACHMRSNISCRKSVAMAAVAQIAMALLLAVTVSWTFCQSRIQGSVDWTEQVNEPDTRSVAVPYEAHFATRPKTLQLHTPITTRRLSVSAVTRSKSR